jgi:hypothetical protein
VSHITPICTMFYLKRGCYGCYDVMYIVGDGDFSITPLPKHGVMAVMSGVI